MRNAIGRRLIFLLGAAVLLVAATGCLKIPEGVGGDQLGAVEVVVVDQFGTPVYDLEVYIQQKVGNTIIQMMSRKTTTSGTVRFEPLQAATFKLWTDPPAGYTGSGEPNAKTVVVVAGTTVNETIVLQKTVP